MAKPPSSDLLVGAAGLLRLNPALGTCYAVDGLRCQDKLMPLHSIHFRTDPVALTAPTTAPQAEPAGPPLSLLAPLIGRVMQANWLLLALAGLLVLAGCLTRPAASAPPAPDTELATVPHGTGPAIAWHYL